jgi:hypothetical protein
MYQYIHRHSGFTLISHNCMMLLFTIQHNNTEIIDHYYTRLKGLWSITHASYEGVFKSSRTGRLEREPQMIQVSAIRYSCIAILWVSLVSFAAITLSVASQLVFIIVAVVHFVMTQSGNFWIHPHTWITIKFKHSFIHKTEHAFRVNKRELCMNLVKSLVPCYPNLDFMLTWCGRKT